MVTASVLHAPGEPMRICEIELTPPGPGEVRVALAATGVCHSDLSLARGILRQAVPAVLGHEGAGHILEVGEGVTHVAVGDPVVLCWAPPCRECWYCEAEEPWLCERSSDRAGKPYGTVDGVDLYPGLSTGGFAAETVVSGAAAFLLPAEVPMDQAALLGCAVMTGWGAVANTAGVRPGQSAVVIGLGGVGLSVIQALRIVGATTIIAVDRSEEKLALARSMGATDTLLSDETTVKAVRGLTGRRGADHAFDCVGAPATIRTAWSASRRGGNVTVVGIGSKDEQVAFTPLELFHFGRTLRGCVYGSMDPARDVPVLIEHLRTGALDLTALISNRIGLDGIDAAFAEMDAGVGARSVVVW